MCPVLEQLFTPQPSDRKSRNDLEINKFRQLKENGIHLAKADQQMRTKIQILTTMAGIILAAQFSTADDLSNIPTASASKLGWFKRTFGNLKWDEVATVVESPREICAKVRHHVRYKEDLGDEHATGAETWERGFGDCEDLAACIVDLCEEIGIDASVVVFRPEHSAEGHAVAMGHWRGKLWMASNGWYAVVDSMDQAKALVSKELRWRPRNILDMSLADAEREVTRGEDWDIAMSSTAEGNKNLDAALPYLALGR
jgi:hypothetical protein